MYKLRLTLSPVKRGMKLLVHSLTSTVLPLKLGNGWNVWFTVWLKILDIRNNAMTYCFASKLLAKLNCFYSGYADQIPPHIRRRFKCMKERDAVQNPLITVHIRRICPLDIKHTPTTHHHHPTAPHHHLPLEMKHGKYGAKKTDQAMMGQVLTVNISVKEAVAYFWSFAAV